ncbi:uncharacterized protein SCHCODRAFT_02614981 [Schizophyllum commune H4-8]|uniref:Yeast cell wall synthesis Kre9/Knh1-like N-terminal domain-containing protein n=1 Tax=Schizophyllum commune (strain H4-8 / FGSC 9210) TaxID=578458 RepID=D8PZQ8_SCHCM|nr:uncharacterized protein SCHCODRAFT_02614981 [Schizophyllum commune H4-8]KAI5896481.1 hypothetical protein SCHCODRAFT_02614981 [Schizophyllum commune H4-8]
MYAATILLALAAAVSAITITEPNSSQSWTNKGGQTVKWQAVDTDPTSFTILLTNTDRSVMPDNNQMLAAEVDSSLGETTVNAPSGGWPSGGSFRVNFVKNTTELNTILAQSDEFDIKEDTSSSSSSSSSVSSTGSKTSATSAGTATIPPTASEHNGAATTTSGSAASATNSNAADATSFGAAGLAGALAFVGAMLA